MPASSSSLLRQLGVGLGFAGGTAKHTVAEVRTDVAWASDAGFDSYWLSHVFGVDPLVALACAASAGTNLAELGTSVMALAGRHPVALAQEALTAQQACDGRLTLGVGPSHEVVVEAIFGERWAGPVQRTDEYLRALIALCNGEPAAVSGEQIHAHAALSVPANPVPVVLAALGPRMLELCGRVADGTHLGNCGPRTIADHIVPRLTRSAETAGRSMPRVIALVAVCVTDQTDAARAHSREVSAGYAALPSYRAMLDREGVDSPADLLLAGSIERVVDGLGEYAAAGVTDLRLTAVGHDDTTIASTREALAEHL